MKLSTGTDPPDPREATKVDNKRTPLSRRKTPEEDMNKSLRVSTVLPDSISYTEEVIERGSLGTQIKR